MFSLRDIRAMFDEAAAKAARVHKEPYVLFNVEEIDNYPPIPFPNLGSYIPKGWRPTGRQWFVDKSGWGEAGEAAFTVKEFLKLLREYVIKNPTYGFAIVEEGQFQVYIGSFFKSPVKRKPHGTEPQSSSTEPAEHRSSGKPNPAP